ncbi:hypothetical protein [Streptomyces natalensis]|uniref:Uncharacterized protein n=1 Tax=Streptomyces natalensis ATCC 27448 TaxID=1240678 RepID=A0A0D7CKI2_9ACTN|nr:hypothetical protein [Streptomyces natalensis]KIZ15957.1 hypothetical protein SNA_22145 [Streptomyces natalensis ATCC 27448]
MPATTSNDATNQQQDTVPARTFWSLLILVLVLLGLLGTGIVVYVIWRHPSLGTPLGVGFTAVTLLVTTVLALSRR